MSGTNGKFKSESSTKITLMKFFAVLCIVASGASIYKYINDADGNYNEKNITTNVAYLSQNMLRASSSAIDGNPNAFKTLDISQNRVSEQLNLLLKGGQTSSGLYIPSPKDSIVGQLNTFKDSVNDVVGNVNYVLGEKQDIIELNNSIDKYKATLNKVLNETRVLATSSSLNGSNAQSTLNRMYQNLSNDRVSNFGNSKDMLNSDYLSNQSYIVQVISSYVKEVSSLPGDISRLSDGNKASRDIDTLFNDLQDLNNQAVRISDLLPTQIKAEKYRSQIDILSDRLNSAYDSLNFILRSDAGDINIWLYFSAIFMVIAIIAILVVMRNKEDNVNFGSDKKRVERYKDSLAIVEDRVSSLFSDESINREYLNQMVIPYNNKTVSKILDRLRRFASNFVILNETLTSDLSHLQNSINEPKALIESSKSELEVDKRKIEKIANSVSNVINTSTNTKKIAEEAKLECEENIANTKSGASKIKDTISKMNSVRDTMQGAQKRIKKLSDTSQSIGEITDTIRTIASQIQVISINAAIEATEAGEAGRKFLVVSKEIEKLAEGANTAVKKIDKIVEDILGDAKQTLSAVETSTAEVVEGAFSADVAGDSLKEINFILDRLQTRVVEVYNGAEKELNQLTTVFQDITMLSEKYNTSENNNNKVISGINSIQNRVNEIIRKKQAITYKK